MGSGIRDHSRVLRSFPELRLLQDPLERQTVWNAAWRILRWRYAGVMILLVAVVMPLSMMAGAGLARILGANTLLNRGFISGLTGGLTGIVISFLAVRICFRRLQRTIRELLVSRGVAVCIQCGYDLQGQTEPRCPECGTAFDLKLLNPQNIGAIHEQ
jgi:hypothetical protein